MVEVVRFVEEEAVSVNAKDLVHLFFDRFLILFVYLFNSYSSYGEPPFSMLRIIK